MVKRRDFLILLLVLFAIEVSSQHWGGRSVFNFLNINQSARVSGLGGVAISVYDADLSLISGNPALLNSGMAGKMVIHHQFYHSDIQHSYTTGAFHHAKTGLTFAPAISYFNYGEISALDQNGEAYGTFKANDLVLQMGIGANLYERLRGGFQLKWVQSVLGQFNSNGLAVDAGILYLDTASQFNIGLVFKNAGVQIKGYEEVKNEPLPFEIILGISKRLKYLPLRISANYRYLNRWDIRYANSEEAIKFLGQENKEAGGFEKFADNFTRHLGISGELLLGQNEVFHLRMGYSHLLRKELGVNDFGSFAGFSFGFGIRAKKFDLDFGRTVYHLAGGVNHLGFGIRPGDFFFPKKID